jgi:hypothetical protein
MTFPASGLDLRCAATEGLAFDDGLELADGCSPLEPEPGESPVDAAELPPMTEHAEIPTLAARPTARAATPR